MKGETTIYITPTQALVKQYACYSLDYCTFYHGVHLAILSLNSFILFFRPTEAASRQLKMSGYQLSPCSHTASAKKLWSEPLSQTKLLVPKRSMGRHSDQRIWQRNVTHKVS